MKRTERDGQLLNTIQKNIKENEKEKNELKKYEVPLILKDEEIEEFINNIEEVVIEYFSVEPKGNTITFMACFGRDSNRLFNNFKPYIIWLRDYYVLINSSCTKEQREFAENWKSKEVTNFLRRTLKLWNETHTAFIMTIYKHGIMIEKKE